MFRSVSTRVRGWGCLFALVLGMLGSRVGYAQQRGAPASTSGFVEDQWALLEGMPSNGVRDIVQTDDGYLWLGTEGGLVRFDGVEFERRRATAIKPQPSTNDRILRVDRHAEGVLVLFRSRHLVLAQERGGRLLADTVWAYWTTSDGAVWMGTDQGVLVYRGGTVERVAPQRIRAKVRGLMLHNDTLWVGTLTQGLFRRDPDGTVTQRTTADGLIANSVVTFAAGRGDTTWIGTKKGLQRWAGGTLTTLAPEGVGPQPLRVVQVRADVRGTCWVRAARGVYRCRGDRLVPYKPGDLDRIQPRPKFISDTFVQVGPDSALYVNTGATLYRNGTPIFETDRFIQSVRPDREGNLWVGTDTRGLFRLRRAAVSMYGTPEGLPLNFVATIARRRDSSLWMGLRQGSLVEFRAGRPVSHLLRKGGRPMRNVWTLHEDRSGQLWAGGSLLCRVEERQCARPEAAGPVPRSLITAIHEDAQGRLWVGTLGRGLFRRDTSGADAEDAWTQFTTENSALPTNEVRWMHESPTGALWLAMSGGGGLVRHRDGTFASLDEGPLAGRNPSFIHQDTTGILWVGTAESGLHRVDLRAASSLQQATVTAFRQRDGFPQNTIYQLLGDEQGRFWINTPSGIFWMEKAALEARARGEEAELRAVHYTTRDGLRNIEGNGFGMPGAATTADGRLWFPNQGGAAVVDPAALPVKAPPPTMNIEAVRKGDSTIAAGPEGTVALASEARTFRVEYTGIRLSDPSAVAFRYRLAGHQDDWVRAQGRREATFARVPPGHYTFEVAGRTKNGPWSTPARLDVSIAPYFYETWWFYGLCALVLVGMGAAVVRWRTWALERRRARLEDQVRQRTSALEDANAALQETNIQLDEARTDALAAAEAKSQFLANMSHEIRTPMNGVIGFADLLADTPLTVEQQEFVQSIRSSGRTLLSIINDILDFSKLEAGAVTLEAQPVQVRGVVEEVLDAVAAEAAEKGLEVTYLVDEAVPETIQSDATRLRQVLLNLLSNAVKFTETGSVEVHVQRGRRPNDRDVCTLQFEVRDTGVGISGEKQDALFGSFTQADASITRQYGGTGLGLSISKRIVEAMDGDISFESEPGVGSTFTFTIEVKAAPVAPSAASDRDETIPALDGRCVLIVEDHETTRALLRQMVEEWGLVPTAVGSGAEALTALEEAASPPALLLLDAQMEVPGGSSLEAQLRVQAGAPSLPLVLVSAAQRQSEVVSDRHTVWVRKPVKRASLREAITRLCGEEVAPFRDRNGRDAAGRTDDVPTRRVLLAEDDRVNQEMTAHMLRKMGHEVTVVGDGREALAALEEGAYDIVLMDVQMPGVDGLEATRRIREARPGDEQPYIVALTAAVTEKDWEQARAAGMDAFLGKPFLQEELAQALHNAVDAGRTK